MVDVVFQFKLWFGFFLIAVLCAYVVLSILVGRFVCEAENMAQA